ncbi:MAG: peroxiredoxin [Chloroflexota bacterium]|nr:peroxiredoxin [Chloroflexota bacterium]MDE2948570.1 peroxiredoxin [Chloroflexota bacterium]
MPTIGQAAPDFELLNQDGKPVRLSDYRGSRVIIFAFPKANTMGCNNQACSFRDVFPQIEAHSAVVLGVSSDSVDVLAGWKRRQKLQYDLLSDPDHKMLDAWDAWGFKLFVITLPISATRSYWVIDEQGILVDMQIGVRPQESVDKALAAVERLSRAG